MTNESSSSSEDAKPTDDEKLEEHVASLYRAVGFRVARDQLIRGNQIDLFATNVVPGYGEVRLIIEVKYRTKAVVPKTEVLNFLDTARSLIDAGECTRALMVTNTSFSRFTKQAVEHFSNLDLQTVADLERSVLRYEGPLEAFLARYKADPKGTSYIDLNLTLKESEPDTLKAPHNIKGTDLMDAALSHPDAAILVFADYGGGKTTTLERIKAKASQNWLDRSGHTLPILFYLRDFSPGEDIDRFISNTFYREFGFFIPIRAFGIFFRMANFYCFSTDSMRYH